MEQGWNEAADRVGLAARCSACSSLYVSGGIGSGQATEILKMMKLAREDHGKDFFSY
jgi:hypothetical protein